MKVAVIGAGITGLVSALDLSEAGVDVVLYESASRLGGKILTTSFSGRMVEEGPDAFLARQPWALDLCRRLGLDGRLVGPSGSGAYVYSRGRLRRIPDGLVLGLPTDVLALARSGLISAAGLARAALEPVAAHRRFRGDVDNLGDIVSHHFGTEILERVVDPLVGGIYAGDARDMSVAAAPPPLSTLRPGSSLLRSLRRPPAAPGGAAVPPGAPPGGAVFNTVDGGLSVLVEALAARLESVDVRLGTAVQSVRSEDGGTLVDTGAYGSERFDAVVCAAPAWATAEMLVADFPDAAALLTTIDYASVVLVTLAIAEDRTGRPLDATGLLVPRPERRFLTACSWGSTKWSYWKSPGAAVLRASAGAADQPGVCELDDETIVARTYDDLERLMGLQPPADQVRVSRWPRSFPQYRPHHLDRIAAMEAALRGRQARVVVTGAGLRGIGIPACVRQGSEAAAAVLERWGSRR